MTAADAGAIIRENWLLASAAVVLVGAGLFFGLAGSGAAPGSTGEPPVPAPETRTTAPSRPAPAARASEVDKVRAVIGEHQRKIEENPTSPDTPVLWNATANLYRQKLGDYREAVRCYETILADFPEWEGNRKVYVSLATCYERLGDVQNAERVFRLMMDAFPADQPEHQYAKERLGR